MADILHESLKGILDREFAIASMLPLIEKHGPYLRELVNYSTNLFARCEKSLGGVNGTPAAIIHLYYHAIQMADGIEVLLSSACFAASAPLLRSLLETDLYLKYMLMDASQFDVRSTAWYVDSCLNQKQFFEGLDESTLRGKQIMERFAVDSFDEGDFEIPIDKTTVGQIIKGLDQLLERPRLADVVSLFRSQKVKKWYQVNNGPRNLEQLAKRIGRPKIYEFIYRGESEIAHAQDARKVFSVSEGEVSLAHIRPGSASPTGEEEVYLVACALLIEISVMTAMKLRPEEPVPNCIVEIAKRHRPDLFGKNQKTI